MSRKRPGLVRRASETAVSWNAVLNAVIILLACFVLLPQLDRFSTSLEALRTAEPLIVLLAFLSGMSTLLFAALTYRLLAGTRVTYLRTLAVQIAGTFTNRLLPAGIGGLGINIRFLMKARFSAAAAATIAGSNNALGFLGHSTLMIVAFLSSDLSVAEIIDANSSPSPWLVGGVVLVLLMVMALFVIGSLRARIVRIIQQAAKQLATYRGRPYALAAGYSSSIVVTTLYVACFYLCLRAVGIDLPAAQTFVVFSLGAATGAVTPTPGGLVGVEAGLFAGLVGFEVAEAPALSAVLLYRLVTYWAPIIPGVVMFRYLQRKGVI